MRSLYLLDMNGQRLAEYLIIENRVIAIPSFAMMDIVAQDAMAPIAQIGRPGWRTDPLNFAGYLVSVAAAHKDDPRLALTIQTGHIEPGGMYEDARLNHELTADALAKVLGLPVDQVREKLRNHLSFPDA